MASASSTWQESFEVASVAIEAVSVLLVEVAQVTQDRHAANIGVDQNDDTGEESRFYVDRIAEMARLFGHEPPEILKGPLRQIEGGGIIFPACHVPTKDGGYRELVECCSRSFLRSLDLKKQTIGGKWIEHR